MLKPIRKTNRITVMIPSFKFMVWDNDFLCFWADKFSRHNIHVKIIGIVYTHASFF